MEDTNKFVIKYKFDPLYSPTYVNGVYGGYSNRGELIAHFYLERWPIPNSQSFEFLPNNSVQELIDERDPKNAHYSILRMVNSGIIMDKAFAQSLYEWLGEMLKSDSAPIKNNSETTSEV